MLKVAAILLLLGVPGSVAAQNRQDGAADYKACLVGYAVINVVENDQPSADAFFSAVERCEPMTASVPDNGGEFSGPSAVQEEVVHMWDNGLAEALP